MQIRLFLDRKEDLMIKPILKWVGGKRQLMPEILANKPSTFNNYIEPFFGGGAVLFELKPKNAIIGDINKELINLYNVIKNNPNELIKELKTYKNDSTFYYEIREKDRTKDYESLSNIKKAARMIYLNKTCFNGLYRVNSKGQNNVPFGNYKNPLICDEETIKDLSKFFNENKTQIFNQSFEKTMDLAKPGDFVYLDPPYDPVNETSFTSYSETGFTKEDQKKLKEKCDELHKKGIKFMLSNSDTEYIKTLYKDYNIKIVTAKRNVNSKAEGRGAVNEVLITNY